LPAIARPRFLLPVLWRPLQSPAPAVDRQAFDSREQAGYCGASARIKFDDEQFAALFNELQARGDKTKLMQLFGH
jgi:hypothetical protein